jgi:hypothetical protein
MKLQPHFETISMIAMFNPMISISMIQPEAFRLSIKASRVSGFKLPPHGNL